ncbi:MAG: hemoglobin/transferrin/lactoferrin receptor protein [Pseudohongiellaceae bacterium]|jgi:hemoglobin/transferrin/lactoferrin receptor protein
MNLAAGRKFALISAMVSLCAVNAASAADNNLETITVTATRAERSISDVAGTVSVISAETIEENMIRDIRDLIRYEPGISVSGGGRFGLSGFTIRGIGGDRVLTQIDGAPASDEFSFGPFLSSRRDFVDVDAVEAVEIIRGPASSLYGSDAIGGVVSFLTKDPADYLSDSESPVYGSVKGGYTSEDNSYVTSATFAAGNDLVQGMLLATYREGDQTETFFDGDSNDTGVTREGADLFKFDSMNLLAKIVFTPNENHRFRLIAETFESESASNALSASNTSSRGVVTAVSLGDDTRDRTRFSLSHEFDSSNSVFDRSFAQVYRQESEADQRTRQEQLSRGSPRNRTRDSVFNQTVTGLELQFDKSFAVAGADNYVVFGFDYEVTESFNIRNGGTTDAITNAPIDEFNPLPTRDFPNSETTETSFYIQDEIALLNGRLTLTPGLRWDRFELDPNLDPVFLAGNAGTAPAEPFADDRVTAKLGAVYDFNDTYSMFAQIAQGFRAPPFDDVNVGFTNLLGGYTTLPNANLEAETSNSFEVGLRMFTENGSLTMTAFHNEYDNFIESLASQGFNPVTGLLEFQAINREEVDIRGIEFKGDWRFSAVDGLSAIASAAYSRGEDKQTGQPVNTVDPMRMVVGLAYQPTTVWNAQLILTAVDRQDRIDSTAAAVEFFETPGYATIDLLGEYNFSDKANLNVGIFNLTDRKYWEWGDVVGREFDDVGLNRFTRPGINASVSLRYEL